MTGSGMRQPATTCASLCEAICVDGPVCTWQVSFTILSFNFCLFTRHIPIRLVQGHLRGWPHVHLAIWAEPMSVLVSERRWAFLSGLTIVLHLLMVWVLGRLTLRRLYEQGLQNKSLTLFDIKLGDASAVTWC